MLLGALVDAGLSVEILREQLSKLPIEGYSIECHKAQRGVIRGTQVTVYIDRPSNESHSIQDFLLMVDASSLPPSVKETACRVLSRIDAAEARVHGESHQLQELGEIDTVIDVVGVVSGIESLGIDKLYSSPLPSGWGVVTSKKGPLPVPVPATMELMTMANARVIAPDGPYLRAGELVTPTGAALITTLASFDVPTLELQQIGYGVGSKDIAELPNVIALWIGETEKNETLNEVALLETNIDDMNPEILGHVHEKLLQHGALDVWFTPIQMKKNRPAVALSVICRPYMESSLIKLILEESSSLGVRVHALKRFEADREVVSVETSLGKALVKLKKLDGKITGLSPEFESCKEIAQRDGLSLQEVYRLVERDAWLGIRAD